MAQSEFNLKIIEEFRANGGETSGPLGSPANPRPEFRYSMVTSSPLASMLG